MLTSFLHIPITPVIQEYISEHKEITGVWLIQKFYTLLEEEVEKSHIQNAFKQVEEFQKWNLDLRGAREFLKSFNI